MSKVIIIIGNKSYNEKDLIGIYEFKKENEISYLIKTFIKLITRNKKIKLIVVKED